jgi:hypothetical protein
MLKGGNVTSTIEALLKIDSLGFHPEIPDAETIGS